MKSQMQTRSSDSSDGDRTLTNDTVLYMSERQAQAYLMARDTIRRIQRTSSIFDSISNGAAERLHTANRHQHRH